MTHISKTANSAAIVSTSLFRSADPIERARAQAALLGLQKAQDLKIGVFLVDGGSDLSFLSDARELGATIVAQTGKTLGEARRQVIRQGYSSQIPVLVYTEIEKDTFIDNLPLALEPIVSGQADWVIPARKSLLSYPPFQRNSEGLLNTFFHTLTSQRFDIAFGPRIWKREFSDYFLKYDGKYGDSWDSIFIPVIRAMAAGLRVLPVQVDYENPQSQTRAESGNLQIELKRLNQLSSICHGMAQEWQTLQEWEERSTGNA